MNFPKKIATSLVVPCFGFVGLGTTPSNAEPVHSDAISLNPVGENEEAWDNLSEDERQKIIDTLNNPEFKIGMSQEEASRISPDLVVETTHDITSSPLQEFSSLARSAATGETYEVVSEYKEKTSQLGIELGWNKIEYRYVTGNNQVLETRSCVGTYNQIVPFRDVNISTNHWLSDGEGACVADWSVSRGAGVLGTENWEQGMTVNGPGIKEKWFFKK